MPKKILIDLGPALGSSKSGVGYYTDMLIDSLAKNNSRHYLVGYYFNFFKRKYKSTSKYQDIGKKEIKITPGKLIPLLKYAGMQPKLEVFIKEKFDFIIFTNYVALPSVRKTPYGLVVYDLSFIDHPEYLNEKNLSYLKKFVPKSINNASLIITISEFTKTRILEEFPGTKALILVTPIPPGVKPKLVDAMPQRLTEMGVVNKKYVLFLGNIEPRKNIANLVEAMNYIPKDYSLVLAGGKGWKDEEIIEAINEAKSKDIKIIQTGYVTEEEKNALYSNAAVFVLPSHYEGFGMPIMEAMQYNAPLAISDIDVFHEVAGNTAVYFNKDEPKDIAKKISELIDDKTLQKRLISLYDKQLAKFSWDKNAQNILKSIDKILEEK